MPRWVPTPSWPRPRHAPDGWRGTAATYPREGWQLVTGGDVAVVGWPT